ncbi:MAG: hypothetical protein ACOYKZ_07835 [Chlamydiia bacterium]
MITHTQPHCTTLSMAKRILVSVCSLCIMPAHVHGLDYLRDDPVATHQPILYQVARATRGPIIEFGCGKGSTPLLHELCKEQGRMLISLDDDAAWLQSLADRYRGDGYEEDNQGWHQFYLVPGKGPTRSEDPAHWVAFIESNTWLNSLHYGCCFIDQAPWLARFETLKRFAAHSDYVVLHDCDYFPVHGIFGRTIKPTVNKQPGVFDFSDVFRVSQVFFPPAPWPGETGPPTLVGSNLKSQLPEIDPLLN